MREQFAEADGDDDHVQREIDRDDHDGEADGFLEPFQEDRAEPGQQHDRDARPG